jgi:uncharacterized membrane protein
MSQAEALGRPVDRLVVFTDGVVAIALTLLILPLLESVSDAAGSGLSTAEFLEEASNQLLSFVLSFVIITLFWVRHHGLFEHIARYNGPLLWLNVGWLLTIVWLPVATAITGSMRPDAVQETVYIGTMLLSSLALTGANLLVRRRPALLSEHGPPPLERLSADLALTVMYAVALLLALVVPGLNYTALFVLFLTTLLERLIRRWLAGVS